MDVAAEAVSARHFWVSRGREKIGEEVRRGEGAEGCKLSCCTCASCAFLEESDGVQVRDTVDRGRLGVLLVR